jgi:hypothetical protein
VSVQPRRISRAATITVKAPLREAFELFGPIKEKDWAEGWDPQPIDPMSEIVEERIVFTTQSHFGQEEPDDIWVVSAYSLGASFIEYTVFAHERVWWIDIVCDELESGAKTRVEITYTYLGLTERGNSLNREALELMFALDLRDWEEAIDHYLETGERKHLR